MERREFLKLGVAGSLAVGLGGLTSCGCSRGERPDIYLIVVDSLRSDHLGCYGYRRPVSSAIDTLARDAVLFRRAYATAPWTTASVASLLSSQYPTSLGILSEVVRLEPRTPILPQLLREHGYRTEGIVSVDMLSRKIGFAEGFDGFDDTLFTGHEGVTSPAVMARAAELAARDDGDPLFALIHTFDPHYNYILHERLVKASAYEGPLRSNYPIIDLWRLLPELGGDDRRFLLDCYDSEVAFTDQHVGLFLDGLRRSGRYDDALIIVTADHGEEFFERGWVGHSISVHREQIQVPLLVKLPGNASATVDTPVSLLDVMPSLLAYLGCEIPTELDGTAHDWRQPQSVATLPVFSETYRTQQHRPGGMRPIAFNAVQLGERKLIFDAVTGGYAVYDLHKDPLELSPSAPTQDEKDQILLRLLKSWLDHVADRRRGAKTTAAERLLDPEQLRRLESLGYI